MVAALLGLATVGDGFVFLVLQDRDDLPAVAFPLLAVGTSLAFVSWPCRWAGWPTGWAAGR